MNIRLANADDLEDIREIATQSELFPPEMLDDIIAPYLTKQADDLWFVAALDDKPIGFAFCEPERMTLGTWNLLALGVLPSIHRQGAGRSLVAYAEEYLSAEGHRILIVETMGIPQFAYVREFYSSLGYDQEATVREFYEAGADKVIFWKKIDTTAG